MDNIFGIYEQALKVRVQRAQLIANNIANAETPGYKAKDLDFKSVLQRTISTSSDNTHNTMTTSHTNHVADLMEPGSFSDLKYRHPTHSALDGNTVDTHLEKSAYLENAMSFQASFRFLNGRITGIIKALQGKS